MNLRRTRAVARKEFLHILRDPRSLVMALLLPLLMMLLFGYGLTLDVDDIPTVVYDADNSPESRALVARFEGSRFFDIIAHAGAYSTAQWNIDSSAAILAVVIAQDYSSDLHAGAAPEVQVLLDGSDSNTASIALGYATALLQQHSEELSASALNRGAGASESSPVDPRIRIWYNSELKSKNYVVPGLIAIILMIIASLLTSLTIAREWEAGTMEPLLSTPLRASELVLGKMAAFFVLGSVDTVLAILSGVVVFEVPLRGSLVFLSVSSGIFLVGALCWGILISSLARSQLVAYQMGMLTSFLPAFLLSGFVFAIENMPPVIQAISYIVPARYFVSMLKGIYLRGVGFEVLWTEVALLLAFAAVVFVAATRRLNRKVA